MNFFVGGVWSNTPPFSLFTNPSSPLSFCIIELSQHWSTWWVLPAGITCWPLVSGIHRVPVVTRNKLLSKLTSCRWFKTARRLCSFMVMQTLVYLTRKLQCLQSLKVMFYANHSCWTLRKFFAHQTNSSLMQQIIFMALWLCRTWLCKSTEIIRNTFCSIKWCLEHTGNLTNYAPDIHLFVIIVSVRRRTRKNKENIWFLTHSIISGWVLSAVDFD